MAKVVNCSEVFESTQCHWPAFSGCQIGDAKGDGMSSVNSSAAAEKVKWFSTRLRTTLCLPGHRLTLERRKTSCPELSRQARHRERWGHLPWGREAASREASVCTVTAEKPKARRAEAQVMQEATGSGSRFPLVILWAWREVTTSFTMKPIQCFASLKQYSIWNR